MTVEEMRERMSNLEREQWRGLFEARRALREIEEAKARRGR